MEYFDRKATFDVEHDAQGIHVKFVSMEVDGAHVPLECREDIERLSDRNQYQLFSARDEVQKQAEEALASAEVGKRMAAVAFWSEMSGKMRVHFPGAMV